MEPERSAMVVFDWLAVDAKAWRRDTTRLLPRHMENWEIFRMREQSI
jgi:hypothetical protein